MILVDLTGFIQTMKWSLVTNNSIAKQIKHLTVEHKSFQHIHKIMKLERKLLNLTRSKHVKLSENNRFINVKSKPVQNQRNNVPM